jgi:SAM-dependent methyltransferase
MNGQIRSARHDCFRTPRRAEITDNDTASRALAEARELLTGPHYQDGVDLYEQLIGLFPAQSTELLAELYDGYQRLPNGGDRYTLYVSRYYDFRIRPGDKVLDIGSGHHPFPFATHLADFAPDDDSYGRAGAPMQRPQDKPFFHCNVEEMPFGDKEFDFVYCSHVLEHTVDPAKACRELMRVAKRGYLETPTPSKDLWLNTARVSNHHWKVSIEAGVLTFVKYAPGETNGIDSDIILRMHCNPETLREKALSSLILLKSRELNTMLYWEEAFPYQVIVR